MLVLLAPGGSWADFGCGAGQVPGLAAAHGYGPGGERLRSGLLAELGCSHGSAAGSEKSALLTGGRALLPLLTN